LSLVIRSRDNALVKRLARLSAHGRARREEGVGIVEGWHLVRALLESRTFGASSLVTVAISEAAVEHPESRSMIDRLGNATLQVIDASVFARIGESDGPNAVLGMFMLPAARGTAAVEEGGLQIWLDAVQDPGNVGTLIRTAAAAGATAVVLGPGCADPWSPKALRAGMGGHFATNVSSDVAWTDAARVFRGRILALALDGSRCLYDTPLDGDVAILLGNEGAGLSPAVAALATASAHIPMPGAVESLNVAAAGAIVCFERVRQQRAVALGNPSSR
jgi:TrmH family RNA methyltransferase